MLAEESIWVEIGAVTTAFWIGVKGLSSTHIQVNCLQLCPAGLIRTGVAAELMWEVVVRSQFETV